MIARIVMKDVASYDAEGVVLGLLVGTGGNKPDMGRTIGGLS